MNAIKKEILEISSKDLYEELQACSVVLIDVRESIENAEESIKGAISMPLSNLEPEKALALKGNKKLVLHCRSGKRSLKAAQNIVDFGCTEIYSLTGGIEAWKEEGYSVEKKQIVPISLMRQVQITAGSLILISLIGAHFFKPLLFLTGFIGLGLVFAGITNTCGLAMLLAKMPWNQVYSNCKSCSIDKN